MMTRNAEIKVRSWPSALALWTMCFAIALGFFSTFATNYSSATDQGSSWYRVLLKKGKIQDYEWAVSARVPKHKPLGKICETSTSFLPRPEFGEVEADESTLCGKLRNPSDSVSMSTIFKSEESATKLLATLYRPDVRKVAFVLSNGEQRVYPSRAANIPNHAARGIPIFRYVVGVFGQEECILRTITYDAQNKVIKQEKSEAPCTPES